jgi:hypothetical protein
MGIKKHIKYYLLGKSVKEIELSRILEKVKNGMELTTREKKFLDLYNETNQVFTDYVYLSKNVVANKIRKLLKIEKEVMCNLEDRNGKIGYPIIDIVNNFESDKCEIITKHNIRCELKDNFLYNLIYNINKDNYSLEIQDEYFEKININK